MRSKIALFCDVEAEAVIPLLTMASIYEVPQMLEKEGLGDLVIRRLNLKELTRPPEMDEWCAAVAKLKREQPKVRIALVGKYVELHDAYMSVREALIHAGLYHDYEIDLDWVHREELERGKGLERLLTADGIVVPGGFGYRGIEGKIIAARIARENKIPYLGLCLGMQVMCIELARHTPGQPRTEQHRVRTVDHASRHRADAGSARYRGHRRHDAPGQLSLPLGTGNPSAFSVRRGGGLRTPPPPLRVQQCLS